jgi:hypothetical protein
LVGDSAEDEPAVWLQVVVLKKLSSTLERQVSAVHEIFVKAVTLCVDVIDLVSILPVDNKQNVWQRVRSVCVVSDCKGVELLLRGDCRQGAWLCLSENDGPAAQKYDESDYQCYESHAERCAATKVENGRQNT